MMYSISFSALASTNVSLNFGQVEIVIDSPSVKVVYISSVMNGITGCNNFNPVVNTVYNTLYTIPFCFSSSLKNTGLTSSIYQSQNSVHIKS